MSLRPHHKYNKEKQLIISFSYVENINIFGYLGAWGGREGSFNNQTGPSWFTSILSFILIYMSNIEAIS